MSDRIETLSGPPQPGAPPAALFRWLTELRAALALPAARTPVLENGWQDAGAPYAPAAFWKRQGVVRLAGAVQGGALDTTALTLPTGFRPAAAARFAVDAEGAHGAVEVTADGRLTPVAGAGARLSLEGITFRAGG